MLADEEWVQLYSHMCLLSVLVSAPPKKDSNSAHIVPGMQHNLYIWILLIISVLMHFMDSMQLDACAHPFFDELRAPNARLPMAVHSLRSSTSSMK